MNLRIFPLFAGELGIQYETNENKRIARTVTDRLHKNDMMGKQWYDGCDSKHERVPNLDQKASFFSDQRILKWKWCWNCFCIWFSLPIPIVHMPKTLKLLAPHKYGPFWAKEGFVKRSPLSYNTIAQNTSMLISWTSACLDNKGNCNEPSYLHDFNPFWSREEGVDKFWRR